MDCRHYITDLPERKSGQHLQREERGAIQALKRQGLYNRAIARELGCSPTTIGNELRRGTPPCKSSMAAMQMLKEKYGDRFAQVFKTITVDNGAEFANFAQCESWGTEVFFAHPYTSWERPQNERHNGLFRAFVPKGTSMQNYSAEYILSAADELNARPRKKLGYATPEELFDSFLDRVYAVDSKPA